MAAVLIGYWTKTGTTGEYAEILGQAISAAGHKVDVKPLAEIIDPGDYDAVVLGAPINGMRPVPELTAFIATCARELDGKPTALFTVSYMYGKAARGFNKAIEKGTARAAKAMGAETSMIFPGRVAANLPGPVRFLFGVSKDMPLDRRDPAAMKAWASTVAAILP
ncbi:MAG TPA: flavodoxin domain-containing protein [bacterium]|nr:flavodoxin domain-containing protein [bacterium]